MPLAQLTIEFFSAINWAVNFSKASLNLSVIYAQAFLIPFLIVL